MTKKLKEGTLFFEAGQIFLICLLFIMMLLLMIAYTQWHVSQYSDYKIADKYCKSQGMDGACFYHSTTHCCNRDKYLTWYDAAGNKHRNATRISCEIPPQGGNCNKTIQSWHYD